MASRARAILEELVRRKRAREVAARDSAGKVARLRAYAFPEQLRFIDDQAKKKAALCTRRSGKTEAIAIYLLIVGYAKPENVCLYLALTRLSAKHIVWHTLKRLNRELGLGIPKKSFNESELTITLPNGSRVRVGGADATAEEREKLLGGSYALVVIDEAASFRTDLRALVYEAIDPATTDTDGTICLVGTPGDFIGPKERRQLFFSITHDTKLWPEEKREGGWEVHRWTTFNNPHMAEKWRARVALIATERPDFVDSPEYARMYEGRWAIDVTKLVYRYKAARNAIAALPMPIRWEGWSGIISVDLGFNDASSFVVSLWRADDPDLYIARAYKRSGLDLTDVAEQVRALVALVPQCKLIVDGASKQAVVEMRGRMKLPFLAADKANKPDFIRHMNTDLAKSKIKVVTPECAQLIEEWATLLWDERASSPKELASCENHCADAALYGWRDARNFMIDVFVPEAPKTDEQKIEEIWASRRQAILGQDEWDEDSPF